MPGGFPTQLHKTARHIFLSKNNNAMTDINLSHSQASKPRKANIPYEHARRWCTQFEDGRESTVKIFVTWQAYVRFCAHAGSDLENEVGGWLLGRWRQDNQSPDQFIVIDTVLPAKHTRFGSTFLTFTQDSQVWMYHQVQEYHPKKELVGWYHTHPQMGVFLSQHDTWLHRNFFPRHFQVALVIEPHAKSGGFFVRDAEGELDAHRYHGFYELGYGRKNSVVHWRNMVLEEELTKSKQGEIT